MSGTESAQFVIAKSVSISIDKEGNKKFEEIVYDNKSAYKIIIEGAGQNKIFIIKKKGDDKYEEAWNKKITATVIKFTMNSNGKVIPLIGVREKENENPENAYDEEAYSIYIQGSRQDIKISVKEEDEDSQKRPVYNGKMGYIQIILGQDKEKDEFDKNHVRKFLPSADGGDEIIYDPEYDPHNGGKSIRYDFPRNRGKYINVCVGAYLKMEECDEAVSGKLGGGHHSGSSGSSEERKKCRCYVPELFIRGGKIRLRKEHPCPEYHTCEEKRIDIDNFEKRWFGVAFSRINTKVNGKDAVNIQIWLDNEGLDSKGKPINNWNKIYEYTDTGQCYREPWMDTFDPENYMTTIRIDESKGLETKYQFCRKVKLPS